MQNVQDIPEKFNRTATISPQYKTVFFTSQFYLFWKVLETYLKTKDIYLL